MGTQKGRVDVQQQPPSLLQTPQLPGAAPARPEVTRLLPTTRLRLALPLSISLLPPSFALRAFSVSPVISLSLLFIITRCRLAHPSTVIYMRTHSGDDAHLLSLSLFFLCRRGWLRAGTRAECDSHQAEANRAVLFRVMKLPRRNATSRHPRQRWLRLDTLANQRNCGTLKFLHDRINVGN